MTDTMRKSINFDAGNSKSWRKSLWVVWVPEYPGLKFRLWFISRNAAITWLKRYGKGNERYRLKGDLVRVINHYVYFCGSNNELLGTAESKRTASFETRNN